MLSFLGGGSPNEGLLGGDIWDGLCCLIAGWVVVFLDSLKLLWIATEADGAIGNAFPWWWPVEPETTTSLLPPCCINPSISPAAAALRAAIDDNSRRRVAEEKDQWASTYKHFPFKHKKSISLDQLTKHSIFTLIVLVRSDRSSQPYAKYSKENPLLGFYKAYIIYNSMQNIKMVRILIVKLRLCPS